ncbi:AMP-binding protein [Corynebacterium macginleyi]|uniref:AMP-binding protein n=1 Tax=Corynebacterium macginleyi TaxID=38290 RepID=A0ABS1Y3N9_9CORY|nr:AMP-binding protein [Corynebacterium macginleyi]MBK4162817.1 AMP-binding protein [Corynebacterium macginleyi]MBK4174323.1 AMP-binding protein [Corynebacterium macginleyi]MBK4179599.1 AMP-binding protein [Corynebacterium macginleyi]MBM0243006.1 AMP-binding protein [Corynebacterium macginleyi]MBM0262684.1 AMP-binding protein [Corynebacterium macginleyi]
MSDHEYDATLTDFLATAVANFPHRPATFFEGETLSYKELDTRIAAAAGGLQEMGIRPGDRVALVLPNCPQHVIAFFAVLRLGAVVVEHNPHYTAHELAPLFAHHGARIALVWDQVTAVVNGLASTVIPVSLAVPLPLSGAPVPHRQAMLADAALILYTSGTTGQPKGVVLTHRNLAANCLQLEAQADLRPGHERFLATLPMFHSYGLTMSVLLAVRCAAEIILLPSPRPAAVVSALTQHRPTWMPGVPTIYERAMRELERGSEAEATTKPAAEQPTDLGGVRYAISGAASLPARIIEPWQDRTGGMLVEGYGLTEASPVLTINPLNEERRVGTIGKPLSNTELRIGDPTDLDRSLPDGTPGEILARGPQVFAGYLDNPTATREAFHDDWLRTGDLGVREADGHFRLVGRIKEVIITGGFNVYPSEVEHALLSHPAVSQAAVAGVPRADGSEDVAACLVLRPGTTFDATALREHCRGLLARYKVPRHFVMRKELPTDQLGKLRRHEVQDILMAEVVSR